MTDFNTMNKTELRAYLIKHPDNKSAFQAFVDRFTSLSYGFEVLICTQSLIGKRYLVPKFKDKLT